MSYPTLYVGIATVVGHSGAWPSFCPPVMSRVSLQDDDNYVSKGLVIRAKTKLLDCPAYWHAYIKNVSNKSLKSIEHYATAKICQR